MVTFERKHAIVLLAVAVWNVVIWARFIKVLVDASNEPTGFYVAHSVLIVGNFIIAGVLGNWGWQAYKATRASSLATPD
ncbi:MAG: hypothetical protein JWQ32_3389 [Marmoricola sp.]|nr:hypothetical protein [Marmoricola sp.]